MLVKSICVLTLFCLMELFSIRCKSVHLVFRQAQETGKQSVAVEKPVFAGTAVYPSPLQFAN